MENVIGRGNNKGKGPGTRRQIVWWTGKEEGGTAVGVSMQGLMANERSPHGRIPGSEVTTSGAFWNFGKMAGCVRSMGWRGSRRQGRSCHSIQMEDGEA